MNITLKPGFTANPPQQGMFWNVWIDYNQDGDFEDNGELAFQAEQYPFLRGDANNDGNVDIADIITIYNVLFQGEGTLTHPDAADVNDDGEINITDGVFLSNYLFMGTVSALPEPFLVPGLDPTADTLGSDVLNGIISIPNGAFSGETKMRIQAKAGGWAVSPCDTFISGEVEDYTVKVLNVGQPKSSGGSNTNNSEEMNGSAVVDDKDLESVINIEKVSSTELHVNIYPNPSEGILNIAVGGSILNGFSYKIINFVGQLLDQEMDVYGQSAQIDVSQFPKGIYMVNVQAGSQQVTNKVIVK